MPTGNEQRYPRPPKRFYRKDNQAGGGVTAFDQFTGIDTNQAYLVPQDGLMKDYRRIAGSYDQPGFPLELLTQPIEDSEDNDPD